MNKKLLKQWVCLALTFVCVFTGLVVNENVAGAAYDKEELKNANIGDTVIFGNYTYKDSYHNRDRENRDMEWIVIDKKDKKLLIISKYILKKSGYFGQICDVPWKYCSIRGWLNKDFIKSAFTKEERGMIIKIKVRNKKNEKYGTGDGRATKDRVFLLSLDEADKYFSLNEERKANYIDGYCGWWWLRSRGSTGLSGQNTYVDSQGSVNYEGEFVSESLGIRPALWVDISGL